MSSPMSWKSILKQDGMKTAKRCNSRVARIVHPLKRSFMTASALFWPIPQAYLDARIAAAVIALINSVGNLGGFVAPTTFGYLEQTTGSIQGGLYGLAGTSILAAIIVFFAKTRPKPADDVRAVLQTA